MGSKEYVEGRSSCVEVVVWDWLTAVEAADTVAVVAKAATCIICVHMCVHVCKGTNEREQQHRVNDKWLKNKHLHVHVHHITWWITCTQKNDVHHLFECYLLYTGTSRKTKSSRMSAWVERRGDIQCTLNSVEYWRVVTTQTRLERKKSTVRHHQPGWYAGCTLWFGTWKKTDNRERVMNRIMTVLADKFLCLKDKVGTSSTTWW